MEDTISKPASKIRITFNRKLTYAERETFYWGVTKGQELDVKWTNDGLVAWIEDRATYAYASDDAYVDASDEADVGSRSIHEIVADFVEMNYVNVHPVATKTLIPEVKI